MQIERDMHHMHRVWCYQREHTSQTGLAHTQFTNSDCDEPAERGASLGINMSSVKIYSWQYHLQLKPRWLLLQPPAPSPPASHAGVQRTQAEAWPCTCARRAQTWNTHMVRGVGGSKKGCITKWKWPLSLIEDHVNTSIHLAVMPCAAEQQPATKQAAWRWGGVPPATGHSDVFLKGFTDLK